jgi:hypothetical protein
MAVTTMALPDACWAIVVREPSGVADDRFSSAGAEFLLLLLLLHLAAIGSSFFSR